MTSHMYSFCLFEQLFKKKKKKDCQEGWIWVQVDTSNDDAPQDSVGHNYDGEDTTGLKRLVNWVHESVINMKLKEKYIKLREK